MVVADDMHCTHMQRPARARAKSVVVVAVVKQWGDLLTESEEDLPTERYIIWQCEQEQLAEPSGEWCRWHDCLIGCNAPGHISAQRPGVYRRCKQDDHQAYECESVGQRPSLAG